MIGKLKKIPLRDVWKKEASHFSTWLEDNIEDLSEAVGFELSVKEREHQVGSFSLDLLAETTNGHLVIIENQLEKTDHTHLGQVLTYLTNLNAKVAIWITSEARQEHVNVINWLNEQTDMQFYLIVIEALAVDDSKPAPYFNVVCRPDAALRDLGVHKKELTDTGNFYLKFWGDLIEKCKGRLNNFANKSPTSSPFLAGSAGRGGFKFVFVTTRKYIAVELYIDTRDAEINEQYFNHLLNKKSQIEKSYGHSLRWEPLDNKRACRIRHVIKDEGVMECDRREVIESLIEQMVKLDSAVRTEVAKLDDEKRAA